MSNEENELEFEIDLEPDLESMGYEMAGQIEFYEHPETGEGAYRSVLVTTSREDKLKADQDYTEAQQMVLITQALLEEYITSERH